MGSEKDSESPRSTSLHAAAPDPKCRNSGRRRARRRRRFPGQPRPRRARRRPPAPARPGHRRRRRCRRAGRRGEVRGRGWRRRRSSGFDDEEPAEAAAQARRRWSARLCLVAAAGPSWPRASSGPVAHRSCRGLPPPHLRLEISESRVPISCRVAYEEYSCCVAYLASGPATAAVCPARGLYAVIAYGCASCPKLTCEREGCQTEFCYHCKQIWHPNQTCDMARQQRAQTLRVRTKHTSGLSYGQESGPDDIKPCPRCSAYIIKMNDGSCNHMTCAVCGCEFCWLCMKEISDLHYLSPSGCTFWGKKPWSRKKKILWQLGTLIGAPVGISLIAGIAIPAMVIGIPVYVGRKIHSRYEGRKTSKHKRNLAITGGVTLSVIASPVIAAVSVGIGVPIMLAYVYGVVPISLCRGGGCGVSTANGKGVKIEFDEDDGPITVADAWRALKNPSIGESSIEGLTSVLSTSGSPTDGLSVMQGPYSETASFAALSGGTLSGGILSSGKGKYSRLEVQADVQKEIFPKDTASLGAISDNASTRAMAGSIISSYNPQDRFSMTHA
uniref:RBR-type E3 ubiquitin transferase n=1 Tax=Rhinopithecus bieti TaxID=61621 RepID=A0A2K6K6H6_RHIBE